MRRACLVGLLVGAILFGPVPAAMAHYVYHKGYAYKGAYCVKSRSEISHGRDDGGYVRVDTWSEYNFDGCGGSYDRPPFHIKAEWVLLYRPNSNHDWGWCKWDLGSHDTVNFANTDYHRNHAYVDADGEPPCSTGYYGTLGNSQVKVGTHWNPQPPNWHWSGSHYLEVDYPNVSCPASPVEEFQDCIS